MTNEDRQQITDLCREHDRFMIEAREWLRSPPMSAAEREGILRRDYDGNALVDVPAAAAASFDEQPYPSLDVLLDGLADGVRALIDRELGLRDARIATLEGKIDVLTSLIGGQKKL